MCRKKSAKYIYCCTLLIYSMRKKCCVFTTPGFILIFVFLNMVRKLIFIYFAEKKRWKILIFNTRKLLNKVGKFSELCLNGSLSPARGNLYEKVAEFGKTSEPYLLTVRIQISLVRMGWMKYTCMMGWIICMGFMWNELNV